MEILKSSTLWSEAPALLLILMENLGCPLLCRQSEGCCHVRA